MYTAAMTRLTRYLMTILAALISPSAFALVDISCLKYEPAIVTLIGVLQARTYPGPPNFVSIEAGDEPETGYYIELKPPICTITKEESWMLGHERISEVQLVVTKMQYDQLGENLGGVVSIKGALFEAFNGHHHTPVLIDVKSFEGTKKDNVVDNIKQEIATKQEIKAAKPTKQTNKIKPTKVTKKAKITKKKK